MRPAELGPSEWGTDGERASMANLAIRRAWSFTRLGSPVTAMKASPIVSTYVRSIQAEKNLRGAQSESP